MKDPENLSRIVAGCQKGDRQSFSQLVDIYTTRCYSYFYRLTASPDQSSDLLSELFVKLLGKIGSYKGGSFRAWLFKIASNTFYDHLRDRQKQKKLIEAAILQRTRTDKPQTKSEAETIDKLQIQLEKLDPETAELLIMRFYSGLSFKELAELRSEPVGTTLSKVHRGLKKLRQLMENSDD